MRLGQSTRGNFHTDGRIPRTLGPGRASGLLGHLGQLFTLSWPPAAREPLDSSWGWLPGASVCLDLAVSPLPVTRELHEPHVPVSNTRPGLEQGGGFAFLLRWQGTQQ